jgi:uncharacterized protein (TIGR00299 family) protein
MRTLYLDCSCGVSGDMLLAALLDAGNALEHLSGQLKRLDLDAFDLSVRTKLVAGVATRRVEVVQTREQPLRHLSDILAIVGRSSLSAELKAGACEVFGLLARAEALVHATTPEQVHFHEIGAVDTIVDVVGVLALVELYSPKRIKASAVNLGSGFVSMAHGTFPVPAPAVAELAKGLTTFATDSGCELATPTGMALLRHLVREFGPLPRGAITAVGYGSGSRSDDKNPTFLRAFLIDEQETSVHAV